MGAAQPVGGGPCGLGSSAVELPVTIDAPAKLTLSLRITGVRDDGFHLVDAEMVSLDLADTLVIGPGDDLVVEAAATGLDVPASDDNLVRRALAAVGRQADVHLTKRIPAGGGLGGGSADAAAVLRWAGVDDLAVAASLGADVPFCLRGGRARVTGIGDVVDPLPFVRGHLHPRRAPVRVRDPAGLPRSGTPWAARPASGPNDLEPAALRVEPRLAGVARRPRRRHRRDAGAGRQRQHVVRPRCLSRAEAASSPRPCPPPRDRTTAAASEPAVAAEGVGVADPVGARRPGP